MRLFKEFNDYSRVAEAQPTRYLADGSQIPLLSVSFTNKYNILVSSNDGIYYVLPYNHNQTNQLPIRSFIHFINYNNTTYSMKLDWL